MIYSVFQKNSQLKSKAFPNIASFILTKYTYSCGFRKFGLVNLSEVRFNKLVADLYYFNKREHQWVLNKYCLVPDEANLRVVGSQSFQNLQ